MATTQAE